MDNKEVLDENIERVGWGLLAVVWGTTILFDFLSFETGLVGTGLVLLGENLIRRFSQLPALGSNTVLGILTLAWGGLEFARPWLGRSFPSADLDWAIFAVLLLGWGVIRIARTLLTSRGKPFGTLTRADEE